MNSTRATRRARSTLIAVAVLATVPGFSAASSRAADSGFALTTGAGRHAADVPQGRVAVSDGRVWVASVKGRRGTLATGGGVLEVVSRRLSGGDEWRWQQPVPSVDGSASLNHVQIMAFAQSGGRVYVEVLRCGPPADDVAHGAPPAACEGAGPRVVTYDARTGALLESTRPDGATGLLPGSGGASYLFTHTAASDGRPGAVLQDPMTAAALPRPLDGRLGTATATPLAGPFYGSYLDTNKRDAFAVVDARSGRTDHTVHLASLYRRAGMPRLSPLAEVVPRLQPDGSVATIVRPDLPDDPPFRRGLYPAFVDRDGRAVRVGHKLDDALMVSASPAGSRVIVSADGGTARRGGRTLRRCSGVWLTTPTGARGAEISGHGALRVSGAPIYWDGETGVWERQITPTRYRTVVRRVAGIPLRAAARPSC